MAKIKNILLLDVETRTVKKDIFDIAWCIANKHGIQTYQNYLVREVYSEEPAQFFGDKQLEAYRKLNVLNTPWVDIMYKLWNDLKNYDISEVVAYNCSFDLAAISQTNQTIRGRNFTMFDNIQKTDLYTVFCNAVKERKDYVNFCKSNSFYTAKGFLKTSAEIAIRFIQDNTDYVECHTALADVFDEFEIYKWVIKSKKKRVMNSQAFPYRIITANKKKTKL